MTDRFKLAACVGILSLVASIPARAERSVGLGVIFGEPTGLTAKSWLDGRQAFDLGLAFSFSDFFLAYGDYLYHFPGAIRGESRFLSELSPYVGVGAVAFFTSTAGRGRAYYDRKEVGAGVRVPLGIEWRSGEIPLGAFLELVPGVGIAPGTFGFLQGGIGARYYF